jgi:hypothetical protein
MQATALTPPPLGMQAAAGTWASAEMPAMARSLASWHREANKQQQPTTISKEASYSREYQQAGTWQHQGQQATAGNNNKPGW